MIGYVALKDYLRTDTDLLNGANKSGTTHKLIVPQAIEATRDCCSIVNMVAKYFAV